MPELRIVTYNLWGYHSPAEFLKLSRGELRGAVPGSPAVTQTNPDAVWSRRRALLTRVLEEADPDVIAFQENVRRPGHPERSLARQIAKNLGMETAEGSFHPKIDAFGKKYEIGVAFLSHLPIDALSETSYLYDSPAMIGGSPQILRATLDFEGYPIRFWVTHLPAKSAEERIRCAETIRKEAEAEDSPAPILLCGDFNAEPDEDPLRIMRESGFEDPFDLLHPGERKPTMPLPSPHRRLDHLLLKSGSPRLIPTYASLIGDRADEEGFYSSDHCGLTARFTLQG